MACKTFFLLWIPRYSGKVAAKKRKKEKNAIVKCYAFQVKAIRDIACISSFDTKDKFYNIPDLTINTRFFKTHAFYCQ